MKNKLGFALSSLIFFSLVFIACQKEVDSKASYIFKPAPSKDAIAKIGNEIVLEKDFYKGIESDLYEAEAKVYEIKQARLQALLLEKFMNQDPNKKGLTNDEFLNKYIAKDAKVTEKEIEKFIKERQIPKEQINEEIKARIMQYLEVEAKRNAVDKWIAKKTKEVPVEVYLVKPERPVFDVKIENAPFKGGADAKVTLVEYSDFQCPFCSKASTIISDLEKKYGNKIKVVFKNYPLPFHTQAKAAANAGLCANEQGMKYFWKMHDAMFADQTKLDNTSLMATAKKIGLKEADFKSCLDSSKHGASIEKDIKEGNDLGIKSTPTFFVNGKLISGAQPIEVFSEVIDEELAK